MADLEQDPRSQASNKIPKVKQLEAACNNSNTTTIIGYINLFFKKKSLQSIYLLQHIVYYIISLEKITEEQFEILDYILAKTMQLKGNNKDLKRLNSIIVEHALNTSTRKKNNTKERLTKQLENTKHGISMGNNQSGNIRAQPTNQPSRLVSAVQNRVPKALSNGKSLTEASASSLMSPSKSAKLDLGSMTRPKIETWANRHENTQRRIGKVLASMPSMPSWGSKTKVIPSQMNNLNLNKENSREIIVKPPVSQRTRIQKISNGASSLYARMPTIGSGPAKKSNPNEIKASTFLEIDNWHYNKINNFGNPLTYPGIDFEFVKFAKALYNVYTSTENANENSVYSIDIRWFCSSENYVERSEKLETITFYASIKQVFRSVTKQHIGYEFIFSNEDKNPKNKNSKPVNRFIFEDLINKFGNYTSITVYKPSTITVIPFGDETKRNNAMLFWRNIFKMKERFFIVK